MQMTFAEFSLLLAGIERAGNKRLELLRLGIKDIQEFDELHQDVLAICLKQMFGEIGYENLSWFIWENDFGRGGLPMDFTGNVSRDEPIKAMFDYVQNGCKKTLIH